MRRKSGILIIFSLFILCAFVALAKNNETEQEGELNGNGLTGTYRVATERQGPLSASCSTATWRGSQWNVSTSASVGNSDPNIGGSYELTTKAIINDSFDDQCYI
jgi:hypothetical protein